MFEVAYSSALRPIEIRSLKREDVDLKNRLLVIRGSKFGKDRVVPLTSYAAKWLEHLFSLSERWTTSLELTGLSLCTPLR
jgi:integrase